MAKCILGLRARNQSNGGSVERDIDITHTCKMPLINMGGIPFYMRYFLRT
jgi:hypothetical protein